VNFLLMPRPLRPGIIGTLGIASCAVFFLGIAWLGLPQALRDLGLIG
jgi:hypothetical protein